MATYTTQNQPLPWVTPYAQDYLARSQEVANRGYQQSPGTYTGPNDTLQAGWQAGVNRAMQGSQVMGAANQQLQNIIGGGFMNANPYLDQSIANAQGDLAKGWNQVAKPAWDKAMSSSGSFGNTGVMQSMGFDQEKLAQQMGRVASDMRDNAYNTERNFMQQALGMAPAFANQDYVDLQQLLGIGSQMQGFQQAAQNQNQNWWQEAQDYPGKQLGLLGQALGMQQGSTSTQTQPDPSKASQIVGGALVGSQVAPSLTEFFKSVFGG